MKVAQRKFGMDKWIEIKIRLDTTYVACKDYFGCFGYNEKLSQTIVNSISLSLIDPPFPTTSVWLKNDRVNIIEHPIYVVISGIYTMSPISVKTFSFVDISNCQE